MNEIDRLLSEGFITEDFLKEEVRCDYPVPSSMKKAWAIQLDLLVKLFEVCKKHNLRIWACGGSMLGAVRHKGFIPWDDDTDVFMPREDHDKLLKLADKEFKAPYFLQSYLNDPTYPFPYARIRNSNTTVEENIYKKDSVTWNNGIFVDIFPLDGVDKINFKLRMKDKMLRFYRRILFNYPAKEKKINTKSSRLLHTIIKSHLFPVTSQSLIRHMHNMCKSKKCFDESEKVGLLLVSAYPLLKNIYSRVDWAETIWLPFENIMMPVPKGYDNVLRVPFGEYMKFPPVDKRGGWHALEFDAETPYSQK